MDARLHRLIISYQERVYFALQLLRQKGIAMPFTYGDWINYELPKPSLQHDDFTIEKHGRGCTVHWGSKSVDFDFGDQGEIDGFDLYRLTSIAKDNLKKYEFSSTNQIQELFLSSIASGEVLYSGKTLYYLKNPARRYAVDVDIRDIDDKLPHRDSDQVLVLYVHYFKAADLMRENFEKAKAKFKRKHSTVDPDINQSIYLSSWLGFLAVSCEGFKKLRMRLMLNTERPSSFHDLTTQSDHIGRLINQHAGVLRELRNDIFHVRTDLNAVRNFFCRDDDLLSWAVSLHDKMASFFSDYRIHCEVHYLTNDRRFESDVWAPKYSSSANKIIAKDD
ncbi:hypothetical protein HX875_05690 [Pseudomonas yamanorum]|uniref:DUF6896 domain-containing protein n=1 Tax=Pseudomonas yamanorum TaxID=515393 RepID=UPI0015A3D734|nr:hypothetical protein [Pseudomonas yamanorum]NWE38953.1 hypothetical protein [Pseudomonas yamanorum]